MLKRAAVLASLAFLAACGGGKQEGEVRFLGFAPVTSKDKDIRSVSTFCPNCHEPLSVDKAKCENKRCKTEVHWSSDYPCPSCQGSGVCPACYQMEQTKGECYNCKGQGVLIYAGKTPICPNCNGTKLCPLCKGTRSCTYCKGEGKISKETVRTLAAAKEDAGLPPSDPTPPEKSAEKQKEEPKKDAGTPEEKK